MDLISFGLQCIIIIIIAGITRAIVMNTPAFRLSIPTRRNQANSRLDFNVQEADINLT